MEEELKIIEKSDSGILCKIDGKLTVITYEELRRLSNENSR